MGHNRSSGNAMANTLATAHFLAHGGTLGALAHISEDDLHTLYAYARQCVKAGDVKTAESLFDSLFCLDAWNLSYALASGLCRQMRGAHQEALAYFARAAIIAPDDPQPAWYAALSYQKLGHATYARQAFSNVLSCALSQPRHAEWEQKSRQALAELGLSANRRT